MNLETKSEMLVPGCEKPGHFPTAPGGWGWGNSQRSGVPNFGAQGLRQGVGIAVLSSSGVGSKPSLSFMAIVPRVLPAPEWLGDLMLILLNLIPLRPPQGAVWREAGLDCRLWGTSAMSHQKALLLISLVRRTTHWTRAGGRLSQSPFPAQEQEDEPKGGAGDQAHSLGSAFHTGFCRALGFWGGTSGGAPGKGTAHWAER